MSASTYRAILHGPCTPASWLAACAAPHRRAPPSSRVTRILSVAAPRIQVTASTVLIPGPRTTLMCRTLRSRPPSPSSPRRSRARCACASAHMIGVIAHLPVAAATLGRGMKCQRGRHATRHVLRAGAAHARHKRGCCAAEARMRLRCHSIPFGPCPARAAADAVPGDTPPARRCPRSVAAPDPSLVPQKR